ncbi:MAG: hypothetical protein VR70_10895 [Rhodospirillaceae bacterium BRH_c57]|nr:MAG: hypothetical protein VR70_10895 [Rhodospirillaceae bacterium BRH_c57]
MRYKEGTRNREVHEVAPHDVSISECTIFHVQPRSSASRGIGADSGARRVSMLETDWKPLAKDKAKGEIDPVVEVQFLFPQWMGEFHESVLLSILAIAARKSPNAREFVSDFDTDEEMDKLITLLDSKVKGDRKRLDRIALTTQASPLLKSAGKSTSAKNYERLHGVLKDLSRVNCGYRWKASAESEAWSTASESLFNYTFDADTGEIRLSLSGRISRIFVPTQDGSLLRYVSISMSERSKLNGDVAILLHSHLCRLVWEGDGCGRPSKKFRPDTMMNYVYREPPKDSQEARDRRKEIRRALDAIDALPGWRVTRWNEDAEKKGPKDMIYFIGRLKTGVGDNAGTLLKFGQKKKG